MKEHKFAFFLGNQELLIVLQLNSKWIDFKFNLKHRQTEVILKGNPTALQKI